MIHAIDGNVGLFLGEIVDNGVILDPPQTAGVDLAKMGKDLIDVFLGYIAAEVFDDDRDELDAVRRF